MNVEEMFGHDEPCFVISVAARMLGVRTQTLRYYERLELVKPSRMGKQRMYSRRDVETVRRIRALMDDLGVNLAGVEVVMRLMDRLQDAETELNRLKTENERLRGTLSEAESVSVYVAESPEGRSRAQR